ncbi:sulfurtransferase TusA family protein [Paracoccus contaminans]|uniref:Preprotein translocase subunit TatB n=1 Tax=Paracoccus contaminans TaxID=1945662 RepID=A0A1W6CW12_9RHOB|nr:sulfurtransferase TusA family protein [Paracoccus contaminans]ARJ69068.1 preprotein translocase subunit TatB [Paracoccus contaminans]
MTAGQPAGADPALLPVEIDARNLLCPLPVLRLRKALMALPPRGRAALTATDGAAVLDVPHFCAQGRHRLVEVTVLADGARRYLVERG